MGEGTSKRVITEGEEQLPVGWSYFSIDSIAKTATGGTPNRTKSEFFGGEIPWVKSGELRDSTIVGTEEFITPAGIRESNAKVFPPGTLLIALYGATVGKVGLLGIPAATNQAVCAVFPDEKIVDTDYLFFALMKLRPTLLKARYGGAQPNISQTVIRNLSVPFPPLAEQRAIAYVLRAVQQAKEATEKVIAASRQLKQSLMKHLFTYGTVPFDQADKVELKETEIGFIPAHWDITDLNQVVTDRIKNGAFFKRDRFNGATPFLNVADTYKDVAADLSIVERVDCSAAEASEYALEVNDVIYVRSSLKREGIGHCCIVEKLSEPAIYDCHLMRVRVDPKIIAPKYLTYYSLSDIGKKELIARSKTTTMTTLNQAGLGSFRVPLPPVAEQIAIQDALEASDGKLRTEKARSDSIAMLFKTLLHHLMTAKVPVPTDTDQSTAEAV